MPRYFIGLPMTGEAEKDIQKLKKRAAQVTESVSELDQPAHVTLVPPFETDDLDWMEALKDVAYDWDPFELRVSGFGHFRERTLFLDVNETPQLADLQNDLLDALTEANVRLTGLRQKEHYHLTLARRDLDPEACRQFLQARQTVQHNPIPVDRLRAWVHMEGAWHQAVDTPFYNENEA